MSDRVVLVTGGSRGIGRAVVEALVAEGTTVAFTFRNEEGAAHEVEAGANGKARAFLLDLEDAEAPGKLAREIEKSVGPIHGLVNNAGIRREGLLAMTPDRDWDAVLAVNAGGAFRCCRAVLPGMMRRRAGAIVNVSSLSAIAGVAGQTAYAASKAALLGFTRALAREVGPRGIRVNAVTPGFVATDMTASLPADAVRELRGHECLPAGTSAADVAQAVTFLLSDRAAAITGQSIVVDAGTSA